MTKKRRRGSLVQKLGSGQHAEVFACDAFPDRAVKVALPPRYVGRQEIEIQHLLSLHGIAPRVHDYEKLCHMPHITRFSMDRLSTIHDVGHGDGWSQSDATQVASLVTRMLEMGIVHNDLHQGNLMRCPHSKELRIIDYGCARKVDGLSQLVATDPKLRTILLVFHLLCLVDKVNIHTTNRTMLESVQREAIQPLVQSMGDFEVSALQKVRNVDQTFTGTSLYIRALVWCTGMMFDMQGMYDEAAVSVVDEGVSDFVYRIRSEDVASTEALYLTQ